MRRVFTLLMGVFQNSIDAKNRVIIPAKFRDDRGPRCVLTRGLDNCLVIYPMHSWEEQQKKLAELPRSDEKARAFLRYIYMNAVDCDIDKQGRTVIPQFLREFAGVNKELVTIGMLDRIEIWAKEVYDNDANGGLLTPQDLNDIAQTYRV